MSLWGEHLIIINKAATPYDECAELVPHESISDKLIEKELIKC